MRQEYFNTLKPGNIVVFDDFSIEPIRKEYIKGDVEGKVIWEITLDEDSLTPFDNMMLVKGCRIFETVKKGKLYIHTEESLRVLRELETVEKAIEKASSI